jgi:hypothetical protein
MMCRSKKAPPKNNFTRDFRAARRENNHLRGQAESRKKISVARLGHLGPSVRHDKSRRLQGTHSEKAACQDQKKGTRGPKNYPERNHSRHREARRLKK